jgi:hypothetical protein
MSSKRFEISGVWSTQQASLLGWLFRIRHSTPNETRAVEWIGLIISYFHHFDRANKPGQLFIID